MKKKRIWLRVLLVLLLLALAWGYLSFNNMLLLPKDGELLQRAPSPDGRHQVEIYRCGGHMTTGFSVLGVVSGDGMRRRNLYWQNNMDMAEVAWLDGETVAINGHRLDIFTDHHDFREHPRQPSER